MSLGARASAPSAGCSWPRPVSVSWAILRDGCMHAWSMGDSKFFSLSSPPRRLARQTLGCDLERYPYRGTISPMNPSSAMRANYTWAQYLGINLEIAMPGPLYPLCSRSKTICRAVHQHHRSPCAWAQRTCPVTADVVRIDFAANRSPAVCLVDRKQAGSAGAVASRLCTLRRIDYTGFARLCGESMHHALSIPAGFCTPDP
ncbi:hypothetical protein BDU57DRAFT_121026 [Ampelomyces quisqualis]|uniref:Uncharacterized protein n=1 Tax=Ampelomyces quisqualis TaxID=50730 RepID=A0A6A5QV96_AMPQU|nr:hypothetical protein BDU57DRAFT_121026 [Ampelomyces quisqualis]